MSEPTSPAPKVDETPTKQQQQQQQEEEEKKNEKPQIEEEEEGEKLGSENDAVKELEAPPSAIKGKSGRERSTDLKPRFNPDITVMESPSYFLVMNAEEGDDETEELAVFDRLYEEAKKRSERVKTLQTSMTSEVDTSEIDKECTFRPVISESAQQLGKYTNWEQFLQSQEERKKTSQMHFQKKKERILSEEIVPLFEDIPRKHSLRIIAYLEKERKYKGPIKGWRARFREYMKKLEENDNRESLMKRNPNSHSDTHSVHSGVIRDDAVFERLYDEAQVREAVQRVVLMTQLEKETRELYHPMTNESEYWQHLRNTYATNNVNNNSSNSNNNNNSINNSKNNNQQHLLDCGSYNNSFLSNRTGSSSGNSSVFESLYKKSEEYRRRRELRVMEAMNNQEDFSFKPSTNPKSSKIIMERAIARARGELPDRNRKPPVQEEEPQEKKGNKRFNADIFCSRLQRKELERLERLAALKRELHSEEASQCTFRPSISRNSLSIAMQKGYGNVIFTPPAPPQPRELLQGGHSLRVEKRKERETTNVTNTNITTKTSNSTTALPAGGFSSSSSSNNNNNNTSQRRVYPQQQAQDQEQESNVRNLFCSQSISSGGSNNNNSNSNTEMLMNVKEFGPETTVEDDKYIVALSSEIQDVLSGWTETVEEATSLS